MAIITVTFEDEGAGAVGVTMESDPPIPNRDDAERTPAQEMARRFVYALVEEIAAPV